MKKKNNLNLVKSIENMVDSYKDDIDLYKVNLDAIDYNYIKILRDSVNRFESINKINYILNNLEYSINIENSIFESTLIYVRDKNIINTLLGNIYYSKLESILKNLIPTSTTQNNTFKKYILNKVINSGYIAYMSPQEIHPELWKQYIQKAELKKFKLENMAATDNYRCKKCGERKCKVSQQQTRSIDEPMTIFVVCLVCHNTFKF